MALHKACVVGSFQACIYMPVVSLSRAFVACAHSRSAHSEHAAHNEQSANLCTIARSSVSAAC